MSKTIFAFRTDGLISLYWVLHIFFYHQLKAELIKFENGEFVISAENNEEVFKKIEREAKTFRIIESRS